MSGNTGDDKAIAPTLVVAGTQPDGSRLDAYDALPWFEGAQRDDASMAAAAAPAWTQAPATFHPGVQSGRMRDEGEIARGGMGSIHRLYDLDLRRRVALKVIDPALAADASMRQRFIDEARITGALTHPNIVPVHDLAVDDEHRRASYTMKLVDGRTLTELIAMQASQRDVERILQVLASVCDALAYSHSRGIVHRDLKPDNIMVGEFGEVYLMDWGCALATTERTLVDGEQDVEGTVAGTVRYMAPEQARGEIGRIDARTDIFSMGAILYKALTGQAPYMGPMDDALAAAQRCEYRSPDESGGVAVKPPPMLTAIVKKAMACEPADRYQSAADLAQELRAFLRGGNWFPLHVFAAGRVIVREGDRADAAYIITAGSCEVRKRDPEHPGCSIALRVLKAGDVFGETAIFADSPRSASVVALEDVSAVVVDRASLEDLVRNTYLGRFVKAMADRFLELEAKGRQAGAGSPR
ncbi:MAG: protein kinase [Betaproteobacteria bacterium]|nr:protein kinase [Betaproteobacteria bacterium]